MKTCNLKPYTLSLLVSAAMLAGCNADKYQEKNVQNEAPEQALGAQQEANTAVSGDFAGAVNPELENGKQQAQPSVTIPQKAQSKAELSTFVMVVKKAGLLGTLNGTGPYTVFAPSNKAFEALPANTLKDLTKPANKQQLIALLNNHIVAGKLDSTALQDGSKIKTLGNGELEVSNRQENVMINGAVVLSSDVENSNGVMHVVDKVLMPEERNL